MNLGKCYHLLSLDEKSSYHLRMYFSLAQTNFLYIIHIYLLFKGIDDSQYLAGRSALTGYTAFQDPALLEWLHYTTLLPHLKHKNISEIWSKFYMVFFAIFVTTDVLFLKICGWKCLPSSKHTYDQFDHYVGKWKQYVKY